MPVPRDLTRAMLAFGAMLRASGLPVTTSAVMDAVRALEAVDLMDRAEVYLALRTVLMSRMEEQPAFDRCFEAFWRFHAEDGQGLDGLVASVQPRRQEEDEPEAAAIEAAREKQAQVALDDWEEGEARRRRAGRGARPVRPRGADGSGLLDLSRRAARRGRPADRADRQAACPPGQPAAQAHAAGGVIDLRRSMRANLMKGEIIELRRRSRRRRKVRLVLLCDVSGSMDLYSRFLLQFLYALQNVFGRVETFTFATRLTRVSDLLRGPSYKGALRRLTEVRDFSGGTRIGESIREFNQTWGRLVDRRTIVLVLSDGWDTGEPDVLAQEMLALKRRAARVIWLNPLLGNPSYEPLTRGMAAALPLVDHFAAAHNLSSLRELAAHLSVR